jgi:hypothetical protein
MPLSLTLRLSAQDQILKRKAFDIYRSQKKVLRYSQQDLSGAA